MIEAGTVVKVENGLSTVRGVIVPRHSGRLDLSTNKMSTLKKRPTQDVLGCYLVRVGGNRVWLVHRDKIITVQE
jgi:hypothetical protein